MRRRTASSIGSATAEDIEFASVTGPELPIWDPRIAVVADSQGARIDATMLRRTTG